MISVISGHVIEAGSDGLVVGVGGVGLALSTPAATRQKFRPGEEVFLYTHLVVRQDALNLYGFETRDERDVFTLLLQVDGVGPRLALSVLSTLSPDAIRRAVFHEQAEVFSAVPGIGKRTAQKIALYLQDRITVAPGMEKVSMISDVDTEVLAALTSLGYSVVEAQTALQSIPRDAPQDVEERLRLALQYFS